MLGAFEANVFNLEDLVLPSGQLVPAWNRQAFCSVRDPIREAQKWVDSVSHLIQQGSKVLILGFGAGFHIDLFSQKFPDTSLCVLELKKSLIDRSKSSAAFQFIKLEEIFQKDVSDLVVLEFRPAWLGQTSEYTAISEQILSVGLPAKDFHIKSVETFFSVDDQSESAKIWRALRELVQ